MKVQIVEIKNGALLTNELWKETCWIYFPTEKEALEFFLKELEKPSSERVRILRD